MAMSVQGSNTQAASIGTEHTLISVTTGGVWELMVNTVNMQNGDELELRAYVKVLASDANPLLVYFANYIHAQGDGNAASGQGEVIKVSPPVSSPHAITFTLKQIAGTGRNYDWRAVTF